MANFGEEEEALQREVTASANAFRISELQYREGIADLLSVLQAQQTLFTAENLLIQVKLARVQADVNLYRALGGGWAENPEEATQPILVAQPAAAAPTTPAPPPATKG